MSPLKPTERSPLATDAPAPDEAALPADALSLRAALARDERFGLLLQLSPPRTGRDPGGDPRGDPFSARVGDAGSATASGVGNGNGNGNANAAGAGTMATPTSTPTPASATSPKPAAAAPDPSLPTITLSLTASGTRTATATATVTTTTQRPRPAHRRPRPTDPGVPAGPEPPDAPGAIPPASDASRGAALDPQQLVDRIATLCRRAGAAMVNWTVTLTLDPQVMPDTVLRIKASQGWMRLRFSTQSAAVVALISSHLPRLQQLLEEALDMKHQLDIDFE